MLVLKAHRLKAKFKVYRVQNVYKCDKPKVKRNNFIDNYKVIKHLTG